MVRRLEAGVPAFSLGLGTDGEGYCGDGTSSPDPQAPLGSHLVTQWSCPDAAAISGRTTRIAGAESGELTHGVRALGLGEVLVARGGRPPTGAGPPSAPGFPHQMSGLIQRRENYFEN